MVKISAEPLVNAFVSVVVFHTEQDWVAIHF